MSQTQETPSLLGHECKFVVYAGKPDGQERDLHVIKEYLHYADGRVEPNLRLAYDYKVPFYVTKKGHQNHKDKKEWEDLEKCDRYMSRRCDLDRAIAKALGKPWFSGDPRTLARSPYLYGSDIVSTAIIKNTYQEKWKDLRSKYRVAVFDTERDMILGTDEINMATISMGSNVYTAVQKSFLQGQADPIARAHEALRKYLGNFEKTDKEGIVTVTDLLKERGIQWVMEIVDDEFTVVDRCFKKAHEWQPDIVAIWNIDYDIPEVMKACDKVGVDPKHVFSDPRIPQDYKFFRYKQGPRKKVTASNKVMPIKPADQWHTVFTPASFYLLDAMCVYRKLRVHLGELPSYSLDSILDLELEGVRKLKFKECDGLTKADWHIEMQTNYKFEYIIYNVFDCISIEMLDEKTNDLCMAMPSACGCSDFEHFKSQPRRVVNELHWFALENGKVMGSTSDELKTEIDKLTVDPDGWIVTLPAHLLVDNGLQCILEFPNHRTNIRVHVADLDVTASYPNGGSSLNISKETTHRELCRIQGVSEEVQRTQGINFATSGVTNCVEIAVNLFNMPSLTEMLAEFEAQNPVQ